MYKSERRAHIRIGYGPCLVQCLLWKGVWDQKVDGAGALEYLLAQALLDQRNILFQFVQDVRVGQIDDLSFLM